MATSYSVKSFYPPGILNYLGMDLKSLRVLLDSVYVAGQTVVPPQNWF